MNAIQISPLETIYVGGTWKKTLDLVPASGSVTVTNATDQLMKKDSTSNVDSSYVTGEPSYSGSQVTTGEVGTGTPPPGKYTYFLTVVTSANTYVLYQDIEFVTVKGR